VAAPELQTLVALRPGDLLRLEAVRDAESRLVTSGGFDGVQVSVTEAAGGLEILFSLTPRHPIDRLEFTGETGLPPGELERQLREQYAGLPAREQPASVGQALVRILQDEGFPDAQVNTRVALTHDPERATLVFDVSAGPRPVIARTEVQGTSPLLPERIRSLTGTVAGRPFRRSDLESSLAAIEDDLRLQGYYSAVALLPNEPILSEAEGGLIVTLLVNAGPRVVLQWDGPRPPGDAEDYVPMRRQRSVDEDLLEDSDERVASYWRRQGYRDVQVSHSREVQGDQLVITMHVDRGLRYLMDAVRIAGNAHLSDAIVRETLEIQPGSPYDPSAIASGIARLRARYLQLGHYQAAIGELEPEEVARSPGQMNVTVRIDIAEGPQATIGTLTLNGVRPDLESAVRGLMSSRPGAPYVRELLQQDTNAIEAFYRNLGFESVQLAVTPTARESSPAIDVAVEVDEGPEILVGDIRVIGNRGVSEESIRERLTLRQGQPFGEEARRESARRLYQMGVFRQVSIDEEPRASGDTFAHVVVSVEELPPTSLGYGGGLEGGRQPLRTPSGTFEDRTFLAPRGFFEIGRRNLWGKNRSIDFFSRMAPRPTTSTSEHFGFLEYRVSTTYREPNAFDGDMDLTLGVSSEQAARTGFNFARRSAVLQVLRRVSPRVSLTGRYSLEYTRLFDVEPTIRDSDQVIIDRLFPQVRLSLLSAAGIWDRRDDLVDPSRGTLTAAEVELASRALGSQVGFAKVFVQMSGFRALTQTRRTVLAGRVELGLARGFERTVIDDAGEPVTVADVPVSQRFFAGGSTTVRGFQIDRLGVTDRPGRPGVITPEGLSIGGNGAVIMNGEVRTRIGELAGREFGLAFFTDAGNVFPKASDIDFSRLRVTLGFGFRYNSPLGPVRLDFGFKTDRETIGGRLERGWEYHLNIGEAF
jgi:outer membrane protein insertion porin family